MTNTIKALIIGGSSGMGLETAKRLLKQGVTVQILAHQQAGLDAAKAELESEIGGVVETTQVNLYDPIQVNAFIEHIKKDNSHIKYLVNAAVFFKPTPFLEHTEKDYDMQIDINKAFFFVTQTVAKKWRRINY